jgi:hypothetical protein
MHTHSLQLWGPVQNGGCRRPSQRRGGASLSCEAHHHQQRASHHRGQKAQHAKHPPPQQGGILPLWGSAVHVLEGGLEHTTAWTRSQASRLSASIEASLPPLPPSADELLEHGPAYAALAAASALVPFIFWRLAAALWRLLSRRRRREAASQLQAVAVEEESVAAAAAGEVGDDPVVIPDADSTAALQRVALRRTKLSYASTLWVITSLLVLFSSDLLNTVSSLRP